MKYKILVYPNLTFASDVRKDSYTIVIFNIIKELNKLRDDLHWTLLLPHKISQFGRLPNVDQLVYEVPSYPNEMRINFDSKQLLELIDWQNNDFDIVYSHLPEHTLQLKNLFANNTNIKPVFIGYTHWTEFPEVTKYEETVMDSNFLGLAEMIKCGINTQAQKAMILKHAASTYNERFIQRLDTILEPQYLGWEEPEYDDTAKALHKGLTIVFNHRPDTYKGYGWFLEQMDRLWDERKDFKVWVPMEKKPSRPYVVTGHNSTRREYFSNLRNCTLGVCCEQKHAGWSISATDGMSMGVPYIFADTPYYRELAGDDACYFTRNDDLLNAIEEVLERREDYSEECLKRFKSFKWSNRIAPFNATIQLAIDSLEPMGDTPALQSLVEIIKTKGSITKRELVTKGKKWGKDIKFSGYRNALRNYPNVRLTESSYHYVVMD